MKQKIHTFLVSDIISRFTAECSKKLDDYTIEGLRMDELEVENILELENFPKNNCKCVDKSDIKESIYFTDDISCFLHRYGIKSTNPTAPDGDVEIS